MKREADQRQSPPVPSASKPERKLSEQSKSAATAAPGAEAPATPALAGPALHAPRPSRRRERGSQQSAEEVGRRLWDSSVSGAGRESNRRRTEGNSLAARVSFYPDCCLLPSAYCPLIRARSSRSGSALENRRRRPVPAFSNPASGSPSAIFSRCSTWALTKFRPFLPGKPMNISSLASGLLTTTEMPSAESFW